MPSCPRVGSNFSEAPAAPSAPVNGRRSPVLTRHGRRPHLNVTLSAGTLAGLDNLPGHLEGHGAITADLARCIVTSAGSVTAVVVDPATGAATAVGATVYRPNQATTDQVLLAAGTCRFPSCRQPAWRCDIDHREPFQHCDPTAGGQTTVGNGDPECRGHHLLKTHTGWNSRQQPDHGLIWTSPTQHTYTDPPREFTLPDEWTTLLPAEQRTHVGIGTDCGTSDAEHAAACATPVTPPLDGVGLADLLDRGRDEIYARARGRIRALRTGEQPSRPQSRTDDAAPHAAGPPDGAESAPEQGGTPEPGGTQGRDPDAPPF